MSLHISKYISYNKKNSSNQSLEKKNNKSGKNSSGKIVIRFKSKSKKKKMIIRDLFYKVRTLNLIVFNRKIQNYKSISSSYILKKDILYPLGILIRNFAYQVLKKKINNFVYFFKRLFFSKNLYLKINLYWILVLIRDRLEYFYNVCLDKLRIGQTIKNFNDSSNKKDHQTLDLDIIKNFYENNFICSISTSNKRIFVSPLTKGLILHIGNKNTLVLTPKKKILKLPLTSVAQIFGSPYLRKSRCAYKKASNFKFLKSRPRVLGKSMNICDRPNGGYKHSSKLLKNYKSQLICK